MTDYAFLVGVGGDEHERPATVSFSFSFFATRDEEAISKAETIAGDLHNDPRSERVCLLSKSKIIWSGALRESVGRRNIGPRET